MEAGYRINASWRAAAFGGLSPRRRDQMHLDFNSDSRTFGAHAAYRPRLDPWGARLMASGAWVAEEFQGHLDRLFWYQHAVAHWGKSSHALLFAYLDFVPRVRLQTALLSTRQELGRFWSAGAGLSFLDVIEYYRRQDLLERLPSSAYKEATLNLRRRLGSSGDVSLDANVLYGVRQVDSLRKTEASAGPTFHALGGEPLSARLLLGARRNFTSNDAFAVAGASWLAADWELGLNLSYALSTEGSGNRYHRWLNELSVGRYFPGGFAGDAVIQQGRDERVSLWGGMLRVSYVFGQRSLAPAPSSGTSTPTLLPPVAPVGQAGQSGSIGGPR
jgi:hypothetical protein